MPLAEINGKAAYAQSRVYVEKKAGRLVPPDGCEGCGDTVLELSAHHEDYDKPLEVTWLCSTCHGKRHTGRKPQRTSRVW